jgi:hypothetical protein
MQVVAILQFCYLQAHRCTMATPLAIWHMEQPEAASPRQAASRCQLADRLAAAVLLAASPASQRTWRAWFRSQAALLRPTPCCALSCACACRT